jgi:hypothetical protein
MKISFIKLGVILVAASIISVFAACKKEKSENKPVEGELVDNPVETEKTTSSFLSADNGTLVPENMPEPKGEPDKRPVIESLSGNSKVISGGTNNISIAYDNSRGQIKEALLSIKGQPGHIIIPASKFKSSTFMLPLMLSQNANGDFTVLVALADVDGNISEPYEIKISTIQAGTGDLQVSISWDKEHDVDLYLELPNGNQIYFGNPYGLTENQDEYVYNLLYDLYGDDYFDDMTDNQYNLLYRRTADSLGYISHTGFLDIDSNAGCYIDSVKNENITFGDNSKIFNGEYIVKADLYEICSNPDEAVTSYTVTTRFKGELVVPSSGKNPFTSSFSEEDESYGDNPIELMRFNISSPNAITIASFDFGSAATLKSANIERPASRIVSKKN